MIDLSRFTKIEKLYIRDFQKGKLNINVDIEELGLINFYKKDLSDISNVEKINKLFITYAPSVKSLDGIEDFVRLEELELDYAPRLHFIESLSKCENIKNLSIFDCNKIEDLFNSISKLVNIEYINLYNKETNVINKINDFSFLNNLNNIKRFLTDYKVPKGKIPDVIKFL